MVGYKWQFKSQVIVIETSSMMDLWMGTTSNDPVVQAKIMTTVRVDRVMPHGTMPVQPRGIFQHMQDLLLILAIDLLCQSHRRRSLFRTGLNRIRICIRESSDHTGRCTEMTGHVNWQPTVNVFAGRRLWMCRQ